MSNKFRFFYRTIENSEKSLKPSQNDEISELSLTLLA